MHSRECPVCSECLERVALLAVGMPEFPSQSPVAASLPLPASSFPSSSFSVVVWAVLSLSQRVDKALGPPAQGQGTQMHPHVAVAAGLSPTTPCPQRAYTNVTRDSLHLGGFREKKGLKRCPVSASSASTACSKQSSLSSNYLLEKSD